MAQPKPEFVSESDYLAYDNANEFRSEYADGQIIMMAGASRSHNVIAMNTSTTLNLQLRGKNCDVYQSDMRIRIKNHQKRKNAYRYPDIVVVCGDRKFVEDLKPDTLINPTVLLEVLSSSTASTDHIKKREEYQQIESLQAYVIIAQDTPRVERYLRQDSENWLYRVFKGLNATVDLEVIGCSLTLEDIYRRIAFEDIEADE